MVVILPQRHRVTKDEIASGIKIAVHDLCHHDRHRIEYRKQEVAIPETRVEITYEIGMTNDNRNETARLPNKIESVRSFNRNETWYYKRDVYEYTHTDISGRKIEKTVTEMPWERISFDEFIRNSPQDPSFLDKEE